MIERHRRGQRGIGGALRVHRHQILFGLDRAVRRDIGLVGERVVHRRGDGVEYRQRLEPQDQFDGADHRQLVVAGVHHRAAVFDPGADRQRRRAVRIDVVGAVLGIVLDHEDHRLRPDLRSRDDLHQLAHAEVVVRAHRQRIAATRRGAVGVIAHHDHVVQTRHRIEQQLRLERGVEAVDARLRQRRRGAHAGVEGAQRRIGRSRRIGGRAAVEQVAGIAEQVGAGLDAGVGAAAVVAHAREGAAAALAVVVEAHALRHRLVEQEVLGREADREHALVAGWAAAAGIIAMQGLGAVIGGVGAGGDGMAVDRHLAVLVEVVEQHELARQRMRVGRDAAGRPGHALVAEADAVVVDHFQRRVAVAARIGTEHLVVGAVLLDHVKHILDLAAGAAVGADHRRAGRCTLGVLRRHRRIDQRGEGGKGRIGRRGQDADAADQHVRHVARIGALAGIVVDARRRRTAVEHIGPGADTARRRPQQGAAIRRHRHVAGVVGGGDLADDVVLPGAAVGAIGQGQRHHRVLAGVGDIQRALIRSQRQRHRRHAVAGGAPERDEVRHRILGRVDHGDAVAVGGRHIKQILLRIGQHVLRLRVVVAAEAVDLIRSADALDRRHQLGGGDVDLRQRAVIGIADVGIAAAALEGHGVGIGPDLDQAGRAGGDVDDRRLVGVVQHRHQGLVVGGQRQSDREAWQLAAAQGMRARAAALRRRQRDRIQFHREPAVAVDLEHMHHVAGITLGRARRRDRVAHRLARDIGARAVTGEHHLAIGAGHRQHLNHRAAGHLDDLHIVEAVSGAHRPVVAAVRTELAAGGEIAHRAQPSQRRQLASAVGDAHRGRGRQCLAAAAGGSGSCRRTGGGLGTAAGGEQQRRGKRRYLPATAGAGPESLQNHDETPSCLSDQDIIKTLCDDTLTKALVIPAYSRRDCRNQESAVAEAAAKRRHGAANDAVLDGSFVGCAERSEAHRLPRYRTRLMRFATLSASYVLRATCYVLRQDLAFGLATLLPWARAAR